MFLTLQSRGCQGGRQVQSLSHYPGSMWWDRRCSSYHIQFWEFDHQSFLLFHLSPSFLDFLCWGWPFTSACMNHKPLKWKVEKTQGFSYLYTNRNPMWVCMSDSFDKFCFKGIQASRLVEYSVITITSMWGILQRRASGWREKSLNS